MDLIGIDAVCRLVGGDEKPVHKGTVYKLIKTSGFPAPVKITAAMRRWRREEVEAWVASRVTASAA